MFRQIMKKISKKGGEEKMKTFKILIVLAFVLGLAYPCFAAVSTSAITISATIPTLTQALGWTLHTAHPDTDAWDSAPASSMSGFGGLTQDIANNRWNAGRYYILDLSPLDNSGNTWYITHAISNIVRPSTTDSLNNSVTVKMVKVVRIGTTETETTLNHKVFGESAVTSNTLLNKTALSGGWLRVYYGIAVGDTANEPANAVPITLDRLAGTYSGTVTYTLAP